MAINPLFPEVPKVEATDMAGYLTEVLGTAPTPGLPSFLEYLQIQRGLPVDFFSPTALEGAALSSELMMYSMFLRATRERMPAPAPTPSLDELVAQSALLQEQLEKITQMIQAAQTQPTGV